MMILNATSEYRVCILVSLLNQDNFQTNILFKTNKCHHGEPPWSGRPGTIDPLLLH